VGPRVSLDAVAKKENLFPDGNQTLRSSSCSLVTILTELPRLRKYEVGNVGCCITDRDICNLIAGSVLTKLATVSVHVCVCLARSSAAIVTKAAIKESCGICCP
jgi:hypothetical protein